VALCPSFDCACFLLSDSVAAASPNGRRYRRAFIRRLSSRDVIRSPTRAHAGACARVAAEGVFTFAVTFAIRSREQASLHR